MPKAPPPDKCAHCGQRGSIETLTPYVATDSHGIVRHRWLHAYPVNDSRKSCADLWYAQYRAWRKRKGATEAAP